jgi:hypothetical protein
VPLFCHFCHPNGKSGKTLRLGGYRRKNILEDMKMKILNSLYTPLGASFLPVLPLASADPALPPERSVSGCALGELLEPVKAEAG